MENELKPMIKKEDNYFAYRDLRKKIYQYIGTARVNKNQQAVSLFESFLGELK